jgi:hypothetical protein
MDCGKRFEITLSYAEYNSVIVTCQKCHSSNIKRLINRVRVLRSATDRLEELSAPENMDRLEDDPQTLGRMMREMSRETGENPGAEFDEVVDRLEKGQTPDEIEREVPDLADGALSPTAMDDL